MKNKKLHSIKKPGFKTPDAYFESIEDRVFDKLKEDHPLEDIQETGYVAPSSYFESLENRIISKLDNTIDLDEIKNTGFKTPDNYFENIEDTILTTLEDEKIVKVIPLFSRRNFLYISGIAAAILIMFSVFNRQDNFGIDSLDLEVVEAYLEEQNLDTYDIASLLTEEDLSEDDFGIINDNFSEESLEDYLIDNANLEDIIEQ